MIISQTLHRPRDVQFINPDMAQHEAMIYMAASHLPFYRDHTRKDGVGLPEYLSCKKIGTIKDTAGQN